MGGSYILIFVKALAGSDLPGVSIAGKFKGFESDIGSSISANTSVRLDFGGDGFEGFNVISEVDSPSVESFGGRLENKLVTRQNLTTGNTTIGSNTKFTAFTFPIKIFGQHITTIEAGGVFETRLPVIPYRQN